MDSVELAGALAHTAGDAGVGADLGDGGPLVLVRAVDEHLLLVGDLDDQLARAGLTAGTAVGALFLVDLGNALVVDVQSVELAGGDAGTEAQAAEGAGGRAAGDLECAHAVGNADVLEVFHSGIAAVADDVSDHLLTAGRFHAHDRGDLGSALRAGGRAGGDGSLAGEDRFRAAGAAGVAGTPGSWADARRP